MAKPREGNLVTVKLDRDVVARLAALKVTYGRRSYSEVIRDLLALLQNIPANLPEGSDGGGA